MRRALAILKYVPAVLYGLLVVAWVVSWFADINVVFPWSTSQGKGSAGVNCRYGGLILWRDPELGTTRIRTLGVYSQRLTSHGFAPAPGFSNFTWPSGQTYFQQLNLPLTVLLTLVLPIAVGSFTRFRFPLWSYFAWTALVAAELAFYLR